MLDRTTRNLFAAAAALCAAAPAHAMSYVAMSDASLLRQADTVVVATVSAAAAAPGHELDATRYDLAVEQVLKGDAAQGIALLAPGAFEPTQAGALNLPGAPRLATGERVLAFLQRDAAGGYLLVHLGLGAFHVRSTVSGTQVAVREMQGAEALGAGAAATVQARTLAGFADWVRRSAAGAAAPADYWNDEALAPQLQPRFAVPSPPARWGEFDNGGSVPFYAGSTGQLGLPGGGYAEFQQAIAAWNATGRVRYAYAGVTNATGTPAHPDGVNKILFNDLGNFIGGVFDCVNGGIAGWGGWRSGAPVTSGGVTVQPILEGDIVIRNGAGCLLSAHANANAAELFAHELGHTLGLNHPCGDPGQAACVAGTAPDQAIMRPTIHGDGRGASLGSDDLQGLAYLYPRVSTGGGSSSGGTNSGSGSGGSGGSGGGGTFHPLLLCLLGLAAWRRRGGTRG